MRKISTRVLRDAYAEGQRDGQLGRARNPCSPSGLTPYWRWAYNEGHRDGLRLLDEMREAVRS